jgi:Kdo2-lipid IVA lauroyltransferase/acyltransferase
MEVAVAPPPMLAPAPRLKIRYLRDIGYFAEASAIAAIALLFGLLPVDMASAIGGFFGRTVGPRIGVSNRTLRRLGRAMPANSDAENRRIIRGMWDNLGRSLAEYSRLSTIVDPRSGRVEIVNGAAIASLLEQGRPAILFGGHFGNWEIGPSVIHRLMGNSLMSVYRAPNNPWIEKLLGRFLPWRLAVPKGSEGSRHLLRHLQNGGSCAMLVDQKMNDGIAVPFFGRPAMTAPAVARLALRFDCPVIPVRVERLEGAHFRFTVLPPIAIRPTGDTVADVLAIMTRVNAEIEDWVRRRPEQWLWLHRRWPD